MHQSTNWISVPHSHTCTSPVSSRDCLFSIILLLANWLMYISQKSLPSWAASLIILLHHPILFHYWWLSLFEFIIIFIFFSYLISSPSHTSVDPLRAGILSVLSDDISDDISPEPSWMCSLVNRRHSIEHCLNNPLIKNIDYIRLASGLYIWDNKKGAC